MRAYDLNILPSFFSLDPSWVLPFPKWRNCKKKSSPIGFRIGLEKEAENNFNSSSFFSSPEERYHVHPEIWSYTYKPFMSIANWILSTWFMIIKDIFLSALGRLLDVSLQYSYDTPSHLASIDTHLYMKQISNLWWKPITC